MICDTSSIAFETFGSGPVRDAIRAAAEHSGEVVTPARLLAAIVLEHDPDVGQLLSQAVLPPSSMADLLVRAERELRAGSGNAPATRPCFSPGALRALDTFESLDAARAVSRRGDGLSLLLACVLAEFDAEDRHRSRMLDTEALRAAVQQQLDFSEAASAATSATTSTIWRGASWRSGCRTARLTPRPGPIGATCGASTASCSWPT